MSDNPKTIRITSEDEAFAFLRYLLSNDEVTDAPFRIEFHGWPTITVHLPATPISGSISPTMMEAFIDLQTAIYRSYLLLTVQSDDLRGMSRSEKEQLEFRVKVREGSSDYAASLASTVEKIGQSAVAKMSSHDLLLATLGVALIVGGVVAWKAWLAHKADQRKSDTNLDHTKLFLESQKQLLAHSEQQARLLVEAQSRLPVLADVDAALEPARQQMVRAVGEEKGGDIQGVRVSSTFADEISTQKRQQSEKITFLRKYRVDKVDTTTPDGFRVTLTDVESGIEITASLQDALVSEAHRAVIRKSEWNKQPILVKISARLLRNRYIDAIILHAEEILTAGSDGTPT